ncbi:MAG: ribose 5-phosphate isomerase A [Nitrosopumilus sp.]|nr:ribose 5-phosphate isomerase A [Nitrosopumilus sp.]MDA7958795.1 ribose 5-phosphate isomerase A [Nitrosopumilus sp.]
MSYEGALAAIAEHAAASVADGSVVGLGSGRAATAMVRALARRARGGLRVTGVPTSLQIRGVAEEEGIPLMDAGQAGSVDVVLDGADQVGPDGTLIKGGGGALLREAILFGMARRVVVAADMSKFPRRLSIPVPVEVHPAARSSAAAHLERMGSRPALRESGRGYPAFTESGNLVLDCDFGAIADPRPLARRIRAVPGVAEAGIFTRRPDTIYKAMRGSRFRIL